MDTPYSIGELAEAVGLPASTIHYYERTGLIRPGGRVSAQSRWYGHDAIERLTFIRAAQTVGFTVSDIRTLLELRDGVQAPCDQVRSLIARRLADIEGRVRELQQVHEALESLVDLCGQSEDDARCYLLEELERSATREPTTSDQ